MQTLDDLRFLGEAELGRPLRVELWEMPSQTLGVAWIDLRGVASIAVNRTLLNTPDQLRHTFWHEVAHHLQGDCKRPEADPTYRQLSAPHPQGYRQTPRERLANRRSQLYTELEQMGKLRTTKPLTAASRKEPTVRTPWPQLIDRSELVTLSQRLRSVIDEMHEGTPGRVTAQLQELDALTGLSSALSDYRQAHSSRTPLKSVTDAQKAAERAAQLIRIVCAYAGVPLPQRLRDLAEGNGRPAPVPPAPTRQKPQPAPAPHRDKPKAWDWADLQSPKQRQQRPGGAWMRGSIEIR